MTALIFKLLGGIGLFLLGMVLLTYGIKALPVTPCAARWCA